MDCMVDGLKSPSPKKEEKKSRETISSKLFNAKWTTLGVRFFLSDGVRRDIFNIRWLNKSNSYSKAGLAIYCKFNMRWLPAVEDLVVNGLKYKVNDD